MEEEGYISDEMNGEESHSEDEATSDSSLASSSASSGPAAAEVPHVAYDSALPIKHSYLGEDLEELSGRTLLEEGSIHKLPIFVHSGLVLVPGQTLPLNELLPATIAMLRTCVKQDRTFGVVCVSGRRGDVEPELAHVGTTAEIYAWQEITDNPHAPEFRVKARGRQRFKLLDALPHSGSSISTVMILRENQLPDILRSLRPRGALGHNSSAALSSASAAQTRWPAWIYAMYDAGTLADQLRKQLKLLISPGDELLIPRDPVLLSYWSAQNLPLADEQRLELLAMDSAVSRLRYQLSFIQKCQVLACSECSARIADPKDVFSMSCEGPQGTYVNPGGFVHETMTVMKATGLLSRTQRPSYQYSWFPGYGWTMVECLNCGQHMGWMFTTKKSSLSPKIFIGLCRVSIKVKIMPSSESEDHANH